MRVLRVTLLSIALSACASSPIAILNHPSRVTVAVDNVEVAVARYGPNEYYAVEANELSRVRFSPNFAMQQNLLTRAIEKATGCKVVTAVMSPEYLAVQTIVKC